MTDREQLLDELRPVAFAIAYRMLGTVSEAEDVVQEALLRVHQALANGEQITSPRAFVATAKFTEDGQLKPAILAPAPAASNFNTHATTRKIASIANEKLLLKSSL